MYRIIKLTPIYKLNRPAKDWVFQAGQQYERTVLATLDCTESEAQDQVDELLKASIDKEIIIYYAPTT